VAGELEEAQYPNDAEELEHVRVLDILDQLLQAEVCVETATCRPINFIVLKFSERMFRLYIFKKR
jgi:hypothetical protein